VATDQGAVALAEFTAALSLSADQAAGLSLEHGLRCCLLATGRAGLAAGELREVYYTALLRSVGCTSDAHEQAGLFGDEIAARAELNLAPHLPARELLGVLVRHSAAGEPPLRRAAAFGRTLAASRDLPRQVAAAHCETAQRLSGRLSLPESVSGALHAVFEHWDGIGFPDGPAGGGHRGGLALPGRGPAAGGGGLPLGSESERARINVTRAIRSAIAKIRDRAPAAAAHLDQAVRTGTRCCYSPPNRPS
jgi:hypothetical protein